MQNIAYYSGFLYCSFGRPYACLVTSKSNIVVSANIDASHPWRRCYGENLIYTDWERDNYLKAIISLLKNAKKIGIEHDHLTLERHKNLKNALGNPKLVDIAPLVMLKRMIKSNEEINLITSGAKIADIGGEALVREIKVGASEMDIAMVGRDAMEKAIVEYHPDSELRDTWVWLQSGINTDGAHNPLTTRKLKHGDILSLNTFPMVSGYYTALERTLFVGEVDEASLKTWEANVKVHKRGIELIKPGAKCSEITAELNALFNELGYLQYRTFGYGHSFGMLSHYYGREGKLELREDVETVLKPNMVVSMEPMILIPDGKPGAGGYREHDILVIKENSAEDISKFPFGPEHNIIK
jgi:creatinase